MNVFKVALLFFVLPLFVFSCAGTQQMDESVRTGFLGQDYAKLKKGGEGDAIMTYTNPKAKWADKTRWRFCQLPGGANCVEPEE